MRITITRDTVTPELARILQQVKRPQALMQAGAKAMQVGISQHLRTLQARGNLQGWPEQKFFAGKSTSVERNVGISEITNTRAVVTIADPRFVHRIEGGTVTPKRRKFLTIPLSALAYALSGKGSLRQSAPDLRMIFTRKGAWLVKERPSGSAGNRFDFWFKLVKSVTHKPHPDEMPSTARLAALAEAAMRKAAWLLFKVR